MAAMTQQDQLSRSWWSAKQNTQRQLEKPKHKSHFNNFVSAIGLKPKKPVLTIHDPPSPTELSVPPPLLTRLPNRPPSKSVSSTVSRVDSDELQTPSDAHYSNPQRRSLLTLSDMDPFAHRGPVTIATPNDPTRLSAYSNNSGSSPIQPKSPEFPTDRISFASSSSQSHGNGNAVDTSPSKRALLSMSECSPIVKRPSMSNLARKDSSEPSPPQSTMHRTGSSTTLTASPSQLRPTQRPRGLTDSGSLQKAGFFVDTSVKAVVSPHSASPHLASANYKSNSPRVVIRQASLQALNPPTAPPRTGLPPPPRSGATNDHRASMPTPAFSSLSRDLHPLKSSAVSPDRQRRISNRSSPQTVSAGGGADAHLERSPSARPPHTPPATLKKALSHQNLRKRVPFIAPSEPVPPRPPSSPTESEKAAPTKHRFPHPRIPLPSLPISLRASNSSQSGLSEPTTPADQKRASSSSHTSGRKRLFSGSSLRKSSTPAPPPNPVTKDEDAQSIVSLKSDQDMYSTTTAFYKPWISSQPTNTSFWEEGSEVSPNSPVRAASDITLVQSSPQSMSGKSAYGGKRSRGFSVRSNATVDTVNTMTTVASIAESETPSTLLQCGPEPARRFQRSNTVSSRNILDGSSPGKASPARPSMAQTAQHASKGHHPLEAAVPDPIERSYRPSVSPQPILNSLPPPPRRRRATVISQPELESEPEVITALSLSPPPTSRMPRLKTAPSIEKAMLGRSIMRKPSFLDIDDDSDLGDSDDHDDDDHNLVRLDTIIGDSFLDFARESFDTVRR